LKVITYRDGKPIGRQINVTILALQQRVGVRPPTKEAD
jgi:hypothetical protein